MKTSFCLFLGFLVAGTLQAQILRPEGVNGGMRNHRAVVSGHELGSGRPAAHTGYIFRDRPAVYAGVHRGTHIDASWRHSNAYGGGGYYGRTHRLAHYGSVYWPSYSFSYYPAYGDAYPYYGYGVPSYQSQGLFLGGLAGAIIGHNSGTFRHDAWRGAAWGAGAGWLLGAIADARRPAVVQTAPTVTAGPSQTTAPAAAQPQQVTIINNYYNAPATPMSGANGLFGRQ
jgi:hypothetical protein